MAFHVIRGHYIHNRHIMNLKTIKLSVAVAAVIAMSACSSPKTNLSYFTDMRDNIEGTVSRDDYTIKIQPDDELFISVTSLVPEATAMYNLPVANPATNKEILSQSTARQQTYIVNKDGNISFPVLGTIHVAGLTTSQLAEQLVLKIGKDVSDPTVKVTLMNFKVNVMGEVRNPGVIPVNNNERITVIDAIAAAGDMTEYGKRENVLLLRETDGKIEYHTLNLNDASIISSPYYYLKQNDVIIVDPNQIRKDNARYNTQNSYRLQVISSIISASSVIASLIIALAVK